MSEKSFVLKVDHVQITIPKTAESAAREFYCEFLGLKEIPKPESLLGRGGLWLDVGGFPVHIGTESDFDRTRTKAHVAYRVENLTAWRNRLEARGIEILDGISIPDCERFEFRDPFGNRVEFLERAK